MVFFTRLAAAGFGALLALGLFVATEASAQTVDRFVIGNGATMINNGSVTLYGTVGQAAVGYAEQEGTGVEIYHGFWWMLGPTTDVPTDPVAAGRALWNSPNPFTTSTNIHYLVPGRSFVTLRIFDLNGAPVATLVDGEVNEGQHEIMWDGKNGDGAAVATGYYYYTLDVQPSKPGAAPSSYRQKMLFVK